MKPVLEPPGEKERQRDASACMKLHQAFALAPV